SDMAMHQTPDMGSGGGGGGGSSGGGGPTPLFPSAAPGDQDNTPPGQGAPADGASPANVSKGGWGHRQNQIDFSITVLHADASTPMESFTRTSDFFTPDCDFQPMPVPVGGAIEGESGYACTGGGDCHLLVVDSATKLLYEMWRANIVNGTFQ